jgi:pilus assembly protein CpaB
MPIRSIATLAVAVLLGLVAVFLVRNYLGSQQGANGRRAAAVATTPVVVAAQQIERGKTVEGGMIKVVNYPASAVPAGAFHAVSDLTGTAADKRVAMRGIAANEPILADAISGPGGRLILSATITEGMRAVSMRSNDIAGVAGFVLPGDHVDILLTRAISGKPVTQVLASDIRVLGVDQTDDQATNAPHVARAITIEVTPELAQKISLAQKVGEVTLTLRHPADELPLTRGATTVADLGSFKTRSGVRQAVVRHRSPPGHEIHVTRGLEMVGYRVLN